MEIVRWKSVQKICNNSSKKDIEPKPFGPNLAACVTKRYAKPDRIALHIGDHIERLAASTKERTRKQRITRASNNARKLVTVTAMTVLAMQVNATISAESREVRFDTDSATIGIDTRCSACISHCEDDFEPGSLRPCDRVVKGFGGTRVTNVKVGTLLWRWEDDQGIVTTFRIPQSYFVPDGKVWLLSPQHWAQTQAKTHHDRRNCFERTYGNQSTLFWNSGQSKRTVALGRKNNVATFSLAHGYDNFEVFCQEAHLVEPGSDPIALPAGIISDDDEDDVAPNGDSETETKLQATWPSGSEPTPDSRTDPTPVDFNLNGGARLPHLQKG